MNKGALVFAFNTKYHDYVNMALWQCHRIKRWLDIPVTLVTDSPTHHDAWDKVIVISPSKTQARRWFPDIDQSVVWNNLDRCEALALTPYDRTLLIDADYVVSSDVLGDVLDHGPDLWCYQKCFDAASGTMLRNLNTYGNHSIPMAWCTVLCFNKSNLTNYLFDCWRMVRQHWQHYRDIYCIQDTLYRNDHALTIALNMVNGHIITNLCNDHNMCAVLPGVDIQAGEDQDTFRLEYIDDHGRHRYQILKQQDFHAMGKQSLWKLIHATA